MENKIQMEKYIRKVMCELGFKPHLTGYNIFKDGIMILLENEERQLWSKELYQELGEKYNMSYQRTERDLRTLIATRTKKNNKLSEFVLKNEDHLILSECLALISEYIKLTTKKDNKQERQISYVEYLLGVPFSSKGYIYLKDAVKEILNNKTSIKWTSLYYKIGKKHNSSMVGAERCLRHVIEVASANHPNNEISNAIYQGMKHFTTSEYISLIATYIRLLGENIEQTIYDDEIIKDTEKQEFSKDMTLEQRVEYIINLSGIPTNIKGYYYLKDAVMYILNSQKVVSWQDVYEMLANTYMITPSKAERGIRYAIAIWGKKLLESNNLNDINKFISEHGIELSNSEFISLISEYIKINSKEYRNEQLENKQVLKKNRN